VGVQTNEKKGSNHTAYFWQYGSPGKGVVFDFRMGRDREGPQRFLNDYAGILQTDGYGAYRNGIGAKAMVHACCLAHARRKFVDAVKVNEYDLESARVVEWMDALFAIDREARDAGMSVEDRHVLRSERAPQLLGQIHEKMLAMQDATLPKSKAGEAVRYTLSLWRKLTPFLEHPVLELSNNLAENSMRPIAIGRRNWLHGRHPARPRCTIHPDHESVHPDGLRCKTCPIVYADAGRLVQHGVTRADTLLHCSGLSSSLSCIESRQKFSF